MSNTDVSIPEFVNACNPSVEIMNLKQYYARMYANYYIRLLQQFEDFNERLRDLEQIRHIDPRESHVFIYARKDLTIQSTSTQQLLRLNNNDITRVNSYLRNKIMQVKYENVQLRSLIERQRRRINQLQEMESLISDSDYY